MSRFGHILFWNGIRVGEWKREDWPRFLWRREYRLFVDRATDAHDKHSCVSGVDDNPLSFEFRFTAVETERSSKEETVPQCKAIRVKYIWLR